MSPSLDEVDYLLQPWKVPLEFALRTFARKFSNFEFFLKILPVKDDALAMSEM